MSSDQCYYVHTFSYLRSLRNHGTCIYIVFPAPFKNTYLSNLRLLKDSSNTPTLFFTHPVTCH
jgi:hypothetical protein